MILTSCSRSPVNKFIDTYNQDQGTFSFTVPSWMVKAGARATFSDFNDEKDSEGFAAIAKSLGKIRFLTAKEGVIPTDAVKNLIIESKNNDYEEYVTVRDKGKIVNVMVQQDQDRVKNLVLLVSGEEEVVIALIEADITIQELEQAQISWNQKRREEKAAKANK